MKKFYLLLILITCLGTAINAQNAILTTIFEDDFEDSDLVDPITNFKPEWTPRPNLTGVNGIVDRLGSFQSVNPVGLDNSKGAILGKTVDNNFTTNALDLAIDLSAYQDAEKIELSFWIYDVVEETHQEDGIFLKKPDGSFVKVYDFTCGSWQNSYGKLPPIDIKKLAEEQEVPIDANFVIRFQQYDDDDFSTSGDRDGIILDNIQIYVPNITYFLLSEENSFSDGFESGLNEYWTHADAFRKGMTGIQDDIRPDGIVEARGSIGNFTNTAYTGNQAVVMGRRSTDGNKTTNALDLHLDLSQVGADEQVELSFWLYDYRNGDYSENGLWLSDDGGQNFVKVYNFDFESWITSYGTLPPFNVTVLSDANGLNTNSSTFIIRFQMACIDDFSGESFGSDQYDGLLIDDVKVKVANTTYFPLSEENSFSDGFESGLNEYWTHADAFRQGMTGIQDDIRPGGIVEARGSIGNFTNTAYTGNQAVVMGRRSTDGNKTTNALDLHLDLSQVGADEQVELSFWLFDYRSPDYSENGLWLSDDGGQNFVKVYNFDFESWTDFYGTLPPFNVTALSVANGLNTNSSTFVIRFQMACIDDFSGFSDETDGLLIDDVKVKVANTTYFQIRSDNSLTDSFESSNNEFQSYWKIADPSIGSLPSEPITSRVRPDGQVTITSSYASGFSANYEGEKGVIFGRRQFDNRPTTNALDLHLDLSQIQSSEQVELNYWIKHHDENTHPEDGIYFSDDDGDTFYKAYNFDCSNWRYNQYGKLPALNLNQMIDSLDLSFSEKFIIRFQQHDDDDFDGSTTSNNMDGIIIDYVQVYVAETIYSSLPFNDNFDNISLQFKPEWTHANPFLKGNTTLQTTPIAIKPEGIVEIKAGYQSFSSVGRNNSPGVVIGNRRDNSLTTNALDLHLNLAAQEGAEEVILEFWLMDHFEENYPQQGIFFSNNAGRTFKKIYSFNPEGTPNSYQLYELNLIELVADTDLGPALAFTDSCVIRFQHRGDGDFDTSFDEGGFLLDDVKVFAPGIPIASITIEPGTTICAGTSVTFTASITNPGNNGLYQWLRNGFNVGVNASTYTTAALEDGDVIEVIYQADNGLSTSVPVTMTVLPILTPSVSIEANEGVVCSNANNILRAVPVNGGTNPSYRWYLNDVAQNTTLSENPERLFTSLQNGDRVRVDMFFSLPCSSIAGESVSSAEFVVTLTPTQTPTVNLQSTIVSGEAICNGQSLQFTALTSVGGQNPEYTWFLNGQELATTPTNVYTIGNFPNNMTHTVRVRMRSSYPCIPSSAEEVNATFTVITQSSITPEVSILSPVGFDLCPGQFVILEAQSTGGGLAPLYQWFVNDVPATNLSTANQTFPTTTLQDGDIIKVSMVSTSPCPLPQTVSSTPQLIRVIQPQITIITSPQVCADQPTPTFTAEFSGGGANPIFQWFVNGQPRPNNNAEPFKFTFLEPIGNGGQTIQVRLTPSGDCGDNVFALSQTLTLSVIPVAPTSVSITSAVGSGQSVCTGDVLTFTASAVNAGQTPIYKWIVNDDTLQVSNSNVFPTNQFLPNQINRIQVKLISSQACASPVEQFSNIYEIFARESIAPQVSIQSLDGTQVCENELVRFAAVPVGGGIEPLYQWYINEVPQGGLNTSNIFQTLILQDDDVVRVVMVSSLSCASPATANSNTITMQVRPAPRVEISSDLGNFLCDDFTVTFTATALNAGTNPTFQWRKDGENIAGATNTSLTLTNTDLTNQSNIDVVMTTTVNCADPTAVSNPINIQVASVVVPEVTIRSVQQGGICAGGEARFEIASVNISAEIPATYVWKIDGVAVPNNNIPTLNAGVLQDGQTVQLEYTTTLSCANPKTVNSNVLTVSTSALEAPSNLQVNALNATTITLSWEDNSSGETKFLIERSVGNDQNFANYTFVLGNQTTFADQVGLLPETAYFYRVRAVNENVNGCFSDYTSSIGAITGSGGIVTALPALQEDKISIYPNPSSTGIYKLHWLQASEGMLAITVLNQVQNEVFEKHFYKNLSENEYYLDLSSLPVGMYFLKITYQDKVFLKKLIRN